MVRRQAGQAGRGDGDAVIGAAAGDNLLLLRLAHCVPVVPDQLHGRVVGLGARVREQDLGHRHRRHIQQDLRQLHARHVRLVGELVIEGQGPQGLGSRLDQAVVVEAQGSAPQAGQPFDILLAVVVPDVDALAAPDHQRAFLQMELQVGVGMDHGGDIAGCRGICGMAVGCGHEGLRTGRTKSRLYRLGSIARQCPSRRPFRDSAGAPPQRPPQDEGYFCKSVISSS